MVVNREQIVASARSAESSRDRRQWQTETALVDQAVEKLIRGPTSITSPPSTREEAPLAESVGLEGLGQEPAQDLELPVVERAVTGDVEAVLGAELVDVETEAAGCGQRLALLHR